MSSIGSENQNIGIESEVGKEVVKIKTENSFNDDQKSPTSDNSFNQSQNSANVSGNVSRYGRQRKCVTYLDLDTYKIQPRRSPKQPSLSPPAVKIENDDKTLDASNICEVSIKQEVLDEDDTDFEIIKPMKKSGELLTDNCMWKVGVLGWAQVNKFPYWPCIVTPDLDSDKHLKILAYSKYQTNMIHVMYFGDNRRHNWVKENSMMPFTSRENFLKMSADYLSLPEKIKKKNRKKTAGFTVNKSVYDKWNIAIEEAEKLLPLDLKQRIKTLIKEGDELDAAKIRKRKISSDQSDDSQLPKKMKLNDSKKNRVGRKSDIDKNVGIHFLLDDDVPPTPPSSHRDSSDESVVIKKYVRKITRSPLPSFQLYYQRNRKGISKISPDSSEEDILIYMKKSWENMSESARKKYIPENQLSVKQPSIDRETNSSEDSITSKRRYKPKIDKLTHLESVKQLKPPNLFRGYKQERVCQICEQPGNLIRCKGPCLSYFHLSCVKPGEDEADSNSEEKTQSLEKGVRKKLTYSISEEKKDSPEKIAQQKLTNSISEETENPEKTSQKKLNNSMKEEKKETPEKSVQKKTNNSIIEEKKERPEKAAEKKLTDKEKTNKNNKKRKNGSLINTVDDNEGDGDDEDDGDDDEKTIETFNTDDDDEIEEKKDPTAEEFKCIDCLSGVAPACFICNEREDERTRCSAATCGKYYHDRCLKYWPQSSLSSDKFICPSHACHTCAADFPQKGSRSTNEKLARCVRCPSTYHASNQCLPAGTEILTGNQIICPKHYVPTTPPINATWCFLCTRGGSLICCDTCPTSFHLECLGISAPEGAFICEDCETGRLPLYGEIVWVKFGTYRWWPSRICFPTQVPDNLDNLPHKMGEFCVFFFGTENYHWVNRGRVFLYQDEDSSFKATSLHKSTVNGVFSKALKDAHELHLLLKAEKINNVSLKPPPYVKLKQNRPVGSVKQIPIEIEATTACECDPRWENPCSYDTDCLNRILLIECDPNTCPAGSRCKNQSFVKRDYPNMEPFHTDGRGWGLKTLERIKSGQFVVEYVGEVIDEAEYKYRIQRKKELRNENYYFLTIDANRTIDAEPKGNLSRFMNHSCQPNCETQKWTVNGDIRIGLFAVRDIEIGEELTFNYNLAPDGEKKKPCLCGAPNCSGFIGLKAQKLQAASLKRPLSQPKVDSIKRKPGRKRKKIIKPKVRCWKCSDIIMHNKDINECHFKTCNKKYHKKCFDSEKKSMCPWHSCLICIRRTSIRCALCSLAYCHVHVENRLTLYTGTNDKLICNNHGIKEDINSIQQFGLLDETNIKDESDNSLEMDRDSLLADSDSPISDLLPGEISPRISLVEVQEDSEGEEFQKDDNKIELNNYDRSRINRQNDDHIIISDYDDNLSDLPSLTTSQVRQIIGSEVVS